jgi:hypothetical protein
MDSEKEQDRLNVFGRSMSRLEVAMNGVIFLLIQCVYDTFVMLSQLPQNWVDKDLENVKQEFWIPTLLLICSLVLINHSIFGGGDDRIDKLCEKYSVGKLVFIKYFLMFTIVFVSLLSPFVILKLFFQ